MPGVCVCGGGGEKIARLVLSVCSGGGGARAGHAAKTRSDAIELGMGRG